MHCVRERIALSAPVVIWCHCAIDCSYQRPFRLKCCCDSIDIFLSYQWRHRGMFTENQSEWTAVKATPTSGQQLGVNFNPIRHSCSSNSSDKSSSQSWLKPRRWLFIELRSINFVFAWFSRRPPAHEWALFKAQSDYEYKKSLKRTGSIKWKEQKAASCYTCWYCDSRAGDIVSMRARKNMKLKLILNPRHSKNIIRSATHTRRVTERRRLWVTERKQESSSERRRKNETS